MKKYETPNIRVDKYGFSGKIMDGYKTGDIWVDPWGDLFKDPDSGETEANILD